MERFSLFNNNSGGTTRMNMRFSTSRLLFLTLADAATNCVFDFKAIIHGVVRDAKFCTGIWYCEEGAKGQIKRIDMMKLMTKRGNVKRHKKNN